MKIGVDARVLFNRELRGIGKYLYSILGLLSSNSGLEFLLFYNHEPLSKFIPQGKNISLKQCEVKKGDRLFLWEQIRLPLEARKEKVDILHCPANTLPLYQNLPTVVTLHDTLLMESDEDETINYLLYTRRILPFAIRQAKKIITPSEHSKKDIKKFYHVKDERIEVIPQGIDTIFKMISDSKFLGQIKQKYGIKNSYIFTLGARAPRKNTKKVIEVYSALKKGKKIDIDLVIAGVQDDAKTFFENEIKKTSLEDNIILLGFVPKEDLVTLYNCAELSLYLSLYEGFGFPAIESMACGCPVVGSNRSSIPELIADSDLLVDPTNTGEIISKIMPLIINQEYRSNKIQSCLKQSQRFNWLVTAEKTLKVYESVLNQKGERCL